MVRRRNRALALIVAVVVALAVAATAARTALPERLGQERAAADDGVPLLIKHGWDIPYPDFVRDNVAEMEAVGFDGVVVTMGELSAAVLSSSPVSYEELAATLAPLAETTFTTMIHNFVIVYATEPGIGTDDPTAAANFANLARAAREVGLTGIVFDNEAYDGPTWKWPEAAPDLSFEQASASAFSRGNQVMQAAMAEWPDITVLGFLGPWVSHPDTASRFEPHFPYNDVSWANQLVGPWMEGMLEATIGSAATLVDGGEIYTARSANDFEVVYDWLKLGVAQQDGESEDLSAASTATMNVGFGVFDEPSLGVEMDPAVWHETLTNALARTDRYVWAYTEAYEWWGGASRTNPVPEEWVHATRAALAQHR
jgi:hypothetical protein